MQCALSLVNTPPGRRLVIYSESSVRRDLIRLLFEAMEEKVMEDVLTRCFLCARPAPTCGHCGLVGVCEAHLALHRPLAQCLPVAVVRAGVKGRMVHI